MSDLFEVRGKTEKGAEWRGEINVEMDGESKTLTVRQLVDDEFWEVMSLVDTDELDALQSDVPEGVIEEFTDLQEKDDLTDEESERLDELQDTVKDEGIDIFETLSHDTYKGIKKAAKYGIEPDESDIQQAISNHMEDITEEYGRATNENVRKYINKYIIPAMIEDSTDFTSFAIGVRALGETLDDSGN